MQLISKTFNICGHDAPTSQTDGQTDDMWSQDCTLHYSASRGNNKMFLLFRFHTTSYWQYVQSEAKFMIFSVLSIPEDKVCTLNRWGGKLNHLLMAYLLNVRNIGVARICCCMGAPVLSILQDSRILCWNVLPKQCNLTFIQNQTTVCWNYRWWLDGILFRDTVHTQLICLFWTAVLTEICHLVTKTSWIANGVKQ